MKYFMSVLLFGLVTGSLLTNSVLANTPRLSLEGASASKVIMALENAGAMTQKTDYGDFVSMKKIECVQEEGEALPNVTCNAFEYGNGVLKIGPSDAAVMFEAFVKAGAKVEETKDQAELLKTVRTLKMNTVDCLDWNVVAKPGENQEVPTCLFRSL